MLKIELHAHTDLDPADGIRYSTEDLIDHAAALQYQALAITLHDRYCDPVPYTRYARERGITLIPGIERTIGRKHLLLINYSAACEKVTSFDRLAELRAAEPEGLVVVPHAAFPVLSALHRTLLDRHANLFDALEVNGLYTRLIDFNQGAIAWARQHGKPLVGNSDLHSLEHLGRTYTLVDAAPAPNAICEAIRAGRVEVRSRPLTVLEAGWTFTRMLAGGARGRLMRLSGRRESSS